MRSHEILVRQVESCRRDSSCHHVLWPFKEILVVRTPRGTVRKNERRLPASASATAALSIIGRRWRYVTHVDNIQLCDINAKLHRRRTIEDGQFAVPELFFALLAQVIGYLGGVFTRLQVMQVSGCSAVEFDEEGIRAPPLARFFGHADGIMKCLCTLACYPYHRRV